MRGEPRHPPCDVGAFEMQPGAPGMSQTLRGPVPKILCILWPAPCRPFRDFAQRGWGSATQADGRRFESSRARQFGRECQLAVGVRGSKLSGD